MHEVYLISRAANARHFMLKSRLETAEILCAPKVSEIRRHSVGTAVQEAIAKVCFFLEKQKCVRGCHEFAS